MKETSKLEFKESISNSFLKTVSAFANYGDGEIIFGITDKGETVGIEDTKKACLEIENLINGNIDPLPEFTLSVNKKSSTVILKVSEGMHKPYMYKLNAYRRSDTSTVPVDRIMLKRLIMEGQNMSFEELPSEDHDLSFKTLEKELKSKLHIDSFGMDTMKTLELCSAENGYNKAAELLADKNGFTGIAIARFGDSINVILDRERHEKISILKMYECSMDMFRKYYSYEQIKGAYREEVFMIPEAAFREAVSNAIVHRTWDVDASINIWMFPDRIEIISPGGLTSGIEEAEFQKGGISVFRNRIIGNVFFRLGLIEWMGTGVKRIKEEYKDSMIKPGFEVTENSIRITLPLMKKENGLTKDQNVVYEVLKAREEPSSVVSAVTGFGKSKTIDILKALAELGYVSVSGNGRGTKYTAK